jgi:murein L,D-transpeptidase YafK
MRKTNLLVLSALFLSLAACTQEEVMDISHVKDKVGYQLSGKVVETMKTKGMPLTSPIMMRIYKEEGVLEIWKAKADNRFDLLKTYKICAWSGSLGPKRKEGDRQAPEGFYAIAPWQMNPNSSYYLAFNTGYPNQYDRLQNSSGTNLMVHGACSSSGCYSMTDAQMLEIFAFARDAFKGGQKAFQLQALPFRMTAENMARHQHNPNLAFWSMLKTGYDHFEITKRPPEVAICDKKYVFNQMTPQGAPVASPAQCAGATTPPALAQAYSQFEKEYEVAYAKADRKLEGYVWHEPTEAERKAVVAATRKGKDIAYAPTGTGLEAGKLIKVGEETASDSLQALLSPKKAEPAAASAAASVQTAAGALPSTGETPVATAVDVPKIGDAVVPVPQANPLNPPATVATAEVVKKKPFWQLWGN